MQETEMKLRESAQKLCNLFGVIGKVERNRKLLNLVYISQHSDYRVMNIYNDFKFSDLGPFSSDLDMDVNVLDKYKGYLYIGKDLEGYDLPEISITKIGMENAERPEKHPIWKFTDFLNKNMITEDLQDISRFLYTKDKYGPEKVYDMLDQNFIMKKRDIKRVKFNVRRLGNELMEELKSNIKNVVYKKGDLTIQDICRELNYENDFRANAAAARLETNGEIISNGEKVAYSPEGRSILLGTYGKPESN
ncbi:MAG: hypothetical protein JSV92_02905 [archaeon]|nr:MAG: hypothetical protein JSV92_02905 [archaeon]